MPHLTLRLLGSIDFGRDGTPLSGFVSDKVRALLIYLAVEHDRPHRRSTLATLFWPEQSGPMARHSLSQALSNVRTVIGDRRIAPGGQPVLLVTRDTVSFNVTAELSVDLIDFTRLLDSCKRHIHPAIERCAICAERLAQMVDLYRGEFLRGFALRDSPEFDDWSAYTREWLHRQALETLETLATHYEQRGDVNQAMRYCTRELELEPVRETAHQRMMRLFWRAGDRSSAMQQYDRCRRILAEQLGLEPDAATDTLRDQIRSEELPAQGSNASPTGFVHQHNLPTDATPFVGREREIAQVVTVLQTRRSRLVTLTGLGGIGKTRLAFKAAASLLGSFADGVFVVPLAALNAHERLSSSIADALSVPLLSDDHQTAVLSYLRDKQMLLVLDNFEQILEAAATVADLLAHAAGLSILVTSRERLRLRGESVLELKGLPVPVDEPGPDEADAMQLFVVSAQRARDDFVLDATQRPAVARICRLVDGLPLAIELAAAWVETLDCTTIADEIARSSDFLTTTLRDVPVGHRSLRTVFEQSWRLLTPDEQYTFRRLAVFRGGAGHDALLAIAQTTLPLLQSLRGKSLLQLSADAGDTRYDLHDLLREYAFEQLVSAGEERTIRMAHLDYYTRLAEAANIELHSPQQATALHRLESEHDNLRAALHWSTMSGEPLARLTLASALGHFWEIRGYWREGRAVLEQALANAQDAPSDLSARALLCTGSIARLQGDESSAAILLERSLALFRSNGDRLGQAQALSALGGVAEAQGSDIRAEDFHEASVRLFREANNSLGIAESLSDLGDIVRRRGDIDRAESLYHESLAHARQVGDKARIASSLHDLAVVASLRGEYTNARTLIEESLALNRELNITLGIAGTQTLLGDVLRLQGDLEGAAQVLGSSLQIAHTLGSRWAIAEALVSLAHLAGAQGDHLRARMLHEQSQALEHTDQHRIAELLATIVTRSETPSVE